MSRDDGFRTTLDHDPRFLHDAKIRRLRREAPNESEGAIRTLLYLGLRDASWFDGERLFIEDAETFYHATTERIDALRDVGLIDAEGRIPGRAWESWFGVARDRRAKQRAGGLLGNQRRHSHSDSPTESPSEQVSDSPSDKSSPSDSPSDSPTHLAPRLPVNTVNSYKAKQVPTSSQTRPLESDRANGRGAGPVAKPKKYDELTATDFGIAPIHVDDSTSFTEKMAKAGLKPEIVPVDRDIMDESL